MAICAWCVAGLLETPELFSKSAADTFEEEVPAVATT
jgi:hypothetical protein